MTDPQRVLYVIGLGVKIPDHVTVAATNALAQCERVYSLIQEPTRLWLPPGPSQQVVNLMPMYVEGALRSDNYARVANTIMEGLLEVPVAAYVTYGNPLCYDSVAQTLVRQVPAADCVVRVLPGISSIDSILCDMRQDMAPGIQIYESSWLVATRTPVSPGAAVILLQLGHFGSVRAHYRRRRPAESLGELISYLGGFYPLDHTVYFVQSSNGDAPPVRTQVRIRDICQVTDQEWAESMYIPALSEPQLEADVVSKLMARAESNDDSGPVTS